MSSKYAVRVFWSTCFFEAHVAEGFFCPHVRVGQGSHPSPFSEFLQSCTSICSGLLSWSPFLLLITESIRLKRSQRSSPTYDWTSPWQLDHSTKCRIHFFFKYLQGTWLHQPITMSNHPFCQEFLPDVQPDRPLAQISLSALILFLFPWEQGPTPAPWQSYNAEP